MIKLFLTIILHELIEDLLITWLFKGEYVNYRNNSYKMTGIQLF